MASETVRLGWWCPAGAGRVTVAAEKEQAERRRLVERGAVVWREGIRQYQARGPGG